MFIDQNELDKRAVIAGAAYKAETHCRRAQVAHSKNLPRVLDYLDTFPSGQGHLRRQGTSSSRHATEDLHSHDKPHNIDC